MDSSMAIVPVESEIVLEAPGRPGVNAEAVAQFEQLIVRAMAKAQAEAEQVVKDAGAWNEVFERWLSTPKRGQVEVSKNTQRGYLQGWRSLWDFLPDLREGASPSALRMNFRFWDVTSVDIGDWKRHLMAQGLSGSTVANRMAAVSSFYSFAMHQPRLDRTGREVPFYNFNPVKMVQRPAVVQYEGSTFLGPEEAKAFLQVIDRATMQGLRDYALFRMYLSTGRRNSELRLLKRGDFEKTGGVWYYRWAGKGKRQKDEVPPSVFENICEYLKAAGRPFDELDDEAYIFTPLADSAIYLPQISPHEWDRERPLSMRQVLNLVKRYAKKAGLDYAKVKVHSLRHTAAHLMRLLGEDVEAVQSRLAHSNLNTTQIYLHTFEGKRNTSWTKAEQQFGL